MLAGEMECDLTRDIGAFFRAEARLDRLPMVNCRFRIGACDAMHGEYHHLLPATRAEIVSMLFQKARRILGDRFERFYPTLIFVR